MAKYFYGDVLLPEIPELADTNYPYLSICSLTLIGTGTVYMGMASTQPWFYNSANSELQFTNSTIYYDTMMSVDLDRPDWEEWSLSSSASTGDFPISSDNKYIYEIIWTNHNILLDNTDNIWLAASEPVKLETITYTWDLTDITNKPTIDFSEDLTLYKMLDKVFTYNELSNSSLTLTIDGATETLSSLGSNLYIFNDVITFADFFAVSPYANYNVSGTIIPEIGLYSADLSYFGTDYTTGTVTLEVPKIPPLYEGEPTTTLTDEGYNMVNLELNGNVVHNDIIFVTYNEVESIEKFVEIDGVLYIGDLNSTSDGPDFTNKNYFILAIPNSATGFYDSIYFITKEAETSSLKLVHYVTGKNTREIEVSVDKTEIPLASTGQFSVVSDNATDSPSYSYSSSDTSIALVDNTGKIIGIAPGTVTITLNASETDLYYAGIASKEITISSRLSNEIYICFSNNNWKTAFPNYYTVTDGANPFYNANTFTYNRLNSYRSAAIGHSGTSLSTIKFYLTNDGTIEFPYRITSEKNYDWLTVTLDGVQIVRVAGTINWTTFSKELIAGEHTLELKYTKDGGGIVNPDACAIGYLRITGILPSYYLVKANNTLYTIVDNALKALSETQISSSLFEEQGSSVIPTSEMLVPLTDPEVFCWWDNDAPPVKLKAIVTGTPPVPQTMITQPYEIPTTGIESISIVSSEDILFSISFDGGYSWLWYEPHGKDWFPTDNTTLGMTKDIVMNIPTDEWYNVSGTATQY